MVTRIFTSYWHVRKKEQETVVVLSMFIYDKRQGGVNVRRIENKLGIHGSPTCELVYKNAKLNFAVTANSV